MSNRDSPQYRYRTFRAEAVVLRHSNWGEADRLVVLYTLEMGKIRAIAKGVRKPHSRKAGHLEPFTQSNLLLARGRDLSIITQAETIESMLPLRGDLLLTTYASYVVELLDRFTYEEGENRALYRLLTDTLLRLCQSSTPDLVIHYFEIRLLDLVGFRPQLFKCTVCGAEIKPQDQFFSAHQGGVVCPKCGPKVTGSRSISTNALRYLRHFQRSSYSEASRASLSPALDKELELIMGHYLPYLLERSLNTPPFLRLIREEVE
jgi:DNA repair protein RecO (recombination protein O)